MSKRKINKTPEVRHRVHWHTEDKHGNMTHQTLDFRTIERAEKLREELKKSGVASYITTVC